MTILPLDITIDTSVKVKGYHAYEKEVVSFFWRSVGHKAISVYKTWVCCYRTVVQDRLSGMYVSRDGSMFFKTWSLFNFWGALFMKKSTKLQIESRVWKWIFI